MKTVLLYSLLVYQLIQHSDATVQCRSLQVVRDGAGVATRRVNLGFPVEIYSNVNHCNQPSNNSYILLHQNHHTGELDIVSQQPGYKFTLSSVQLDSSGIYCTYKQCAPQEKEQCCVRVIVPPEITIVFPAVVQYSVQQHGVCTVKTWPPLLTTDGMNVFKNGNCAIAKDPLSYIDIYTIALFFTLEMNINSTCFSVSCHTNHGHMETKNINITVDPTMTTTSIPTTLEYLTPSSTTGPTSTAPITTPKPSITPECTCNGTSRAPGIYRITLWITVLTSAILSTSL